MNRQDALNVIWRKLLIIFVALLALSILLSVSKVVGPFTVLMLTFVVGNIGGYVGIHNSLSKLTDAEVKQLSGSWLGLVVPSFVGGILACVLYVLFISGIISGELFPKIVADTVVGGAPNVEGYHAIFNQHADGFREYAKLLFWTFVAGFNQKYVVDVIESIKSRQDHAQQDAPADRSAFVSLR